MTLESQRRLAKHIFRLLKVNEIIFSIGRTNKGNFGIRFTENNDEYELYLDAVPLSIKDSLVDENNIELKRMLEKYWFEKESMTYQGIDIVRDDNIVTDITKDFLNPSPEEFVNNVLDSPKRKPGRPKKVINDK